MIRPRTGYVVWRSGLGRDICTCLVLFCFVTYFGLWRIWMTRITRLHLITLRSTSTVSLWTVHVGMQKRKWWPTVIWGSYSPTFLPFTSYRPTPTYPQKRYIAVFVNIVNFRFVFNQKEFSLLIFTFTSSLPRSLLSGLRMPLVQDVRARRCTLNYWSKYQFHPGGDTAYQPQPWLLGIERCSYAVHAR